MTAPEYTESLSDAYLNTKYKDAGEFFTRYAEAWKCHVNHPGSRITRIFDNTLIIDGKVHIRKEKVLIGWQVTKK